METIVATRRRVGRMRTVFRILLVSALLPAAAALWAGANCSSRYFAGFFFTVPPAAAAAWVYYRFKHLQKLLRLREGWTKPVNRERDFATIGLLFRHLHRAGNTAAVIDDQTWRDLDLNRVYTLLDHTLTAEGQAVLYHLLRTPCYTAEPLSERDALINAFIDDTSFREKLQLALLPLEKRNETGTVELLWGTRPPPSPFVPLYTFLALAALLSPLSLFFLGARGSLLILGLFSLNTYVHHRVKRNFAFELPAISCLAVLLRAAGAIAKLEKPEIGRRRNTLRNATAACRKIQNKTRLLQPQVHFSDQEMLLEYVKYFFLLEVRAFYAALGEIGRQLENLRQIYFIVGELDALQALASYRAGRPAAGYAQPRLATDETACFDAVDLRHPLLDKAVANSFAAGRQGVIITGSNMAGKSTFLRTIGLNALLAQTIFSSPAAAYRGSYFRILTSISREDSLEEGKSFYYREAERLLKLIRAAGEKETKTPALCIIDELLSGTNYTERLAASEAILNHLAQENALIIIATHDLDLAEKLQNRYRCYHFTDQVSPDGLHFDYKLKSGPATTRNAIKLLAHLGYPDGIIAQAESTAGQNSWQPGRAKNPPTG